jgi:hypothetical protein
MGRGAMPSMESLGKEVMSVGSHARQVGSICGREVVKREEGYDGI